MYFRLTKTKTSPVLQLVKSFRDEEGRPRQKILISLGGSEIPKELWKEVAQEIENQLRGIRCLFKPSKEVSEWSERIIKELNKKGHSHDQKAQKPSSITVNPLDVSHSDTTELGPLLPVLKAREALGFEAILSKLGLSSTQILDAGLSIMNRLLDPCPENRLPDWVKTTSFADLFGKPIRVTKKDRFYRIADKLLTHKEKIELALREKERSLFNLDEVMILYDMTNTYFEGSGIRNPKAKRGHSKKKRFDAPLASVGLALDSEGFIIRHEIFAGNQHDSQSLMPTIEKLSNSQASKPLIALDSGFASEENLKEITRRGFDYIVVGKRPTRLAYKNEFATLPFKKIKGREGKSSVEIACKEEGEEKIVLCLSSERGEKEKAIITNAFASIVQARPCPIFGRPDRLIYRLRPGISPQTLRIPPHD